jgi:hypothetical protein
MPFIHQIVNFINNELKASSLNKKKLQPIHFYGLSTLEARSPKGTAQNQIELLPAIVNANGKAEFITPDSKYALQLYHKLHSKVYAFEKKSFGNEHYIKCTSEVTMVVFTNSKLTGVSKENIEPLIMLGLPQKLSAAVMASLNVNKCLITPIASNLNQNEVFAQEFSKSAYFLNEQLSMFSTKYKIEMSFSKNCIDTCLCN